MYCNSVNHFRETDEQYLCALFSVEFTLFLFLLIENHLVGSNITGNIKAWQNVCKKEKSFFRSCIKGNIKICLIII